MDTINKIIKARRRMLVTEPFFATLAMHMAFVEDDKAKDIWTDGNTLAYNPAYVEAAKPSELEALVAKAVTQCASFHHTRRGNRDLKEWNRASSYVVNPIIRAAGFKLPEGSLFRADLEGYTVEEVFKKLQAERKNSDKSKGQDDKGQKQDQSGAPSAANGKPDQSQAGATGSAPAPGAGQSGNGDDSAPGEIRDAAPSHEPAALKDSEIEWTVRTRQALASARKKGSGVLPGHLQDLDVATIQPRIDWRAEMRNFSDRTSASSRDWNTPNRRFISSGLYLPGKKAAAVSHGVLIIDCSSSIDVDACGSFRSENAAALDEGIFDRVTVVYCNVQVTKTAEYERGESLQIDTKGGGGTRFSPAFKWVADNIPDAACIIYFTDLDCKDFGPEPDAPVLWAAYGDSKDIAARAAAVPFGDTIYLAD